MNDEQKDKLMTNEHEHERTPTREVTQKDWVEAVRSIHTSSLDTLRRMHSQAMGEGDPELLMLPDERSRQAAERQDR